MSRGSSRRKLEFAVPAVILLLFIIVLGWDIATHAVPVLRPHGVIGQKERELIIIGVLLSVFVVVPVYILTIMIAWRYRESNTQARYRPDWDHSRRLEGLWWGIPGAIILFLSFVTWNSAHQLDPYRALASTTKPLTVQVVALDWKWLFMYPGQNVASVNEVMIPVGTPVDFEITSDSVMNSFWVPALGGQIYAMPGMVTRLHLVANQAGNYDGASANISGQGFSGMKFVVKAGSTADFDHWVRTARQADTPLDTAAYNRLAEPSSNNPVAYYSSAGPAVYYNSVMKYMMPMAGSSSAASISAMPKSAATAAPSSPSAAPSAASGMPDMDMSKNMNMNMAGMP